MRYGVDTLLSGLPSLRSTIPLPRFVPPRSYALQTVDKLRILPIRQVEPLLILKLHIPWVCPLLFLDLVLSDTPEMNEKDVEETQGVAHDYGNLGGDVARGVFGSEGLRADDVTGACVVSD